ncbi:MAG: ATP:cob(I)alamin adenosyltransferase [Chloroflexi bacterium]|nr:MAG: ATP:cob(I)alamin adenosyltransferase [Chloroflexota bacterium]PIE80874.1 MAG: ATP:cob(I)alamin adenosyltransferase [Chloroflexota bacterium]
MPRLTKIYTKKGDAGDTSLAGGQRVAKESRRIQAYGTVDELNAQLGMALALGLCERLTAVLPGIQNELFNLGSDLAFLEEDKQKYELPGIGGVDVAKIEELIDEMNAVVGSLENFILPGGTKGAAQLHVARTVCRRAERDVIALSREEPVGEFVVPYLNRLSDALFVMSRYENKQAGQAEPLWDSRR